MGIIDGTQVFVNFIFSEPCHDIRYNLIAIVPDKRPECEKKLKTFKEKRFVKDWCTRTDNLQAREF